MLELGRAQVLAYRAAAQGLHRDSTEVGKLAVLDIGVQDAAPELARLAFDARLTDAPPPQCFGPGTPLALVWSLRGAPHVHRRADLDALAAALYPLSEADAAGRLNETGPSIARQGISAIEQYDMAARELRAVVREPIAKGAASTAVTQRIPPPMRHACRACKTSHISDSAMRNGALAAGLELQPGTAPPVLQRRAEVKAAARIPRKTDLAALRRLIIGYLTLLGPASQADVAGYLETRRADLAPAWPDGLVEVTVDGRAAWLPEVQLDAMAAAPPPEIVRLLGAFDPWLQARDRDVIVPDRGVHRGLWPVLGRPGVLLVDGEVVGMWRPKLSGRSLTVAVEAFAPLPPSVWRHVEDEAQRLAAVRGATAVTVRRTA